MTDDIQLVKNIDVSKIKFGDVKVQEKTGGKLINVSYDGKSRFVIQTPEMRAPFGVNKWDKEGPVKYSLNLSFGDAENRPPLQTFLEFLKEMDKLILQTAFENSQKWFKKKYPSIDVLEALYTPLVKYSVDKQTSEITDKYPPTVKLNIPYKDNKIRCEAYDKDANEIDLLEMNSKGSFVTAIVQFSSIWIVSNKFGCAPGILQVQMVPPATIKGYSFKKITEDEIADKGDIDEESVDENHEISSLLKEKATVNVADSDEEEDEEEEDDEEDDDDEIKASVTQQPLKKVVKSKK